MQKEIPFLKKGAIELNNFRFKVLEKVILILREQEGYEINSALDAGCGIGIFSQFLFNLNMKVKAFDARKENVEMAKSNYPNIDFFCHNVEENILEKTKQKFDFVLCFGLLYHLENPLIAIRNLIEVTNKFLLLEFMVYPDKKPVFYLRKEPPEIDQSINYLALVPSKSALVFYFKELNFNIYDININYFKNVASEYKTSIFKKKSRDFLLITKQELKDSSLFMINKQLNQSYESNLLHYRVLPKFIFKLKRFIWK